MNLKKLFVLLAACVFATFALAGCGGSNSASSGSGSSAKVLKVGSSIDFAPFEFQDEGQKEYQGFDMDLIRAIGKEPRSDNLSVTREIASPSLAEKLLLPTDAPQTLVFVRRRVMADDTPVLFSTDILPLSLFDNKRLEGIDFSQPIFDIAARHCHTEVTETVAHLHAVSGPAGIRRQLALRPEQALLQLEEICYSRLCKPVLCCQTYYTDFFDFAMVRKLL